MATSLLIQETKLSDAFGVNDSGEQAGTVGSGSFSTTAAVWQGGNIVTLTSLGGSKSEGMAVNNAGEVVGSSSTSANSIHAVSWVNGVITDLNEGWFFSTAAAVNDKGDIAGSSDNVNLISQAELWIGGKATQLGDLGGGTSIAWGLNDSDQVVGKSAPLHSASHAFLWQNGVMTDLGTLGGTTSEAVAINNGGAAVGDGTTAQGTDHAALWQGGHVRDLGTLGGNTSSATGIDTAGQIVGESATQMGADHAFVWENGAMIDLNTLLAPGSGWELQAALAVSAGGVVIGYGTYNGVLADFALTLPSSGVTESAQAAVQSAQAGLYVGDTAQNISNNLDALEALSAKGNINAIGFSGMSTPVIAVTYAQVAADAMAIKLFSGAYELMVGDSAANVSADLGGLEQLAQSGKLAGITLSDSGIPTVSVTAGAFTADAAAINAISGNFSLSETAPTSSATIVGATNALGNTLVLSGKASAYTVTPSGDGMHFTLTNGSVSDQVSGITDLKFADFTDLVASQTPPVPGAVSSAQITELYGAVFGRTPDVAGLAFYQNNAKANSTTPFLQYAEWFLSSPEYTGNAAHNYPQTTAGNTQFITDCYNSLLGRAPDTGAATYYETNVINPMLSGLTPATAIYAAAELQARAQVLVYFSQSPEFLNDVSTAGTGTPAFGGHHWLVLI